MKNHIINSSVENERIRRIDAECDAFFDRLAEANEEYREERMLGMGMTYAEIEEEDEE